jgi:outer membrane protein OmpA-like peptidoglycan-associated protein
MSYARGTGGVFLATGLAATMGLGSFWSAQSLQSTLADQARMALESRALVAIVQFDGRDATVWASSSAARDQAVAALLTIPGVRLVVAGDGIPPENPSAGSTLTVTRAASPSKSSASATTSVSTSGTASLTPTVAAAPTSTSTPTVSSTPTASASSVTASAAPTPSATKLTIPVWTAIQFEGGTSALDAADKAELVQIAQFMVAHPTIKVAFTGHTDMGRTGAERQALGMARAKAAAVFLTANGVAAPRIATLSQGGAQPVASNATAQGRAANRRVTLVMTEES